jgi:hypothetical protein
MTIVYNSESEIVTLSPVPPSELPAFAAVDGADFVVSPPAPPSELPVFVSDVVEPPPAPPSELPVFVSDFVVPPPAPPSELPAFAFFVTADSPVSLPPPHPATTTDNVNPSDNMTIALVAFNFFIFAPIV